MIHTHPKLEADHGLDIEHVIVDRADYEEALRRCSTPPAVALSRRNLLSLLHKLGMPGSERTIIKPTPNGRVIVSAVSDEEAYRNRPAGPMHSDTEEFIVEVETLLEARRKRGTCTCGPGEACSDCPKG